MDVGALLTAYGSGPLEAATFAVCASRSKQQQASRGFFLHDEFWRSFGRNSITC